MLFRSLFRLGREKKLVREFPTRLGKVAYHLPCHLKSQNIGFRSKQLLEFAGAEVEMIDRCSGVDGTWGMKARHYEQSLAIAEPLLRAVRELDPDHVASDCPLAAQRISQETGRRTVHPVVPPRVDYALTPLGKSAVPIITALRTWGSAYRRKRTEHAS